MPFVDADYRKIGKSHDLFSHKSIITHVYAHVRHPCGRVWPLQVPWPPQDLSGSSASLGIILGHGGWKGEEQMAGTHPPWNSHAGRLWTAAHCTGAGSCAYISGPQTSAALVLPRPPGESWAASAPWMRAAVQRSQTGHVPRGSQPLPRLL